MILQVPVKTKNIDKFKADCKNGIIQNVIETKNNIDGKGIVLFVIKCEEQYKNKIVNLGFKYFKNNEEWNK
jgi:hypothetical protein